MDYTHYDFLDLPPGASAARIEAAYQTIKQRFHGSDDDQLVRMIHEAYTVLSDAERQRVGVSRGDLAPGARRRKQGAHEGHWSGRAPPKPGRLPADGGLGGPLDGPPCSYFCGGVGSPGGTSPRASRYRSISALNRRCRDVIDPKTASPTSAARS